MKLRCSPRKLILIFVLAMLSSTASSEVYVIVNSNSDIKSAAPEDIADLYLNKRNELSGVKLVPIDLIDGSVSRDRFYDKVVQKTPSQIKSYWSRIIFTGKGNPPKQYTDEMEIVDLISEEENILGYVDSHIVNDKVKVIYVIP